MFVRNVFMFYIIVADSEINKKQLKQGSEFHKLLYYHWSYYVYADMVNAALFILAIEL